jgi:hypothetical protein
MVFLAISSSPRNFAIYIVAVDEIWSISATIAKMTADSRE